MTAAELAPSPENCVPDEPLAIDDNTILTACPEVSIREEAEEDGKHLLYEPENENVFLMNATAKRILDSCDGHKTVAQIVEDLAQQYEIPEGVNLRAVVVDHLTTLLVVKILRRV